VLARRVQTSAKAHQGSCSVAEKRGGALLRVSVYGVMSYLVMLIKLEKVIVEPHADSDQHQNLTTSRGSPLGQTQRAHKTFSKRLYNVYDCI